MRDYDLMHSHASVDPIATKLATNCYADLFLTSDFSVSAGLWNGRFLRTRRRIGPQNDWNVFEADPGPTGTRSERRLARQEPFTPTRAYSSRWTRQMICSSVPRRTITIALSNESKLPFALGNVETFLAASPLTGKLREKDPMERNLYPRPYDVAV
jgi:hypothetical protein